MQRGNGAATINAWWEGRPGERYWLDVTGRDDPDKLLAAPRGEGRWAASWTHRLITHVRGGDVVFHYDAIQQAIVAWSISHGRVGKKQLSWPLRAEPAGNETTSQRLPSWGILLRHCTKLSAAVPLAEIARIQWSLFPSLRELEDEVGDPLYYPFEIGNREATRPLAGYVFKLPAVFVQSFPELASVASHVTPRLLALETSPSLRRAPVPRLHEASGSV